MNAVTIRIGEREVVLPLNAKDFSTGSKGFHATSKLETPEGKYQVNVLAVLIGSKEANGRA